MHVSCTARRDQRAESSALVLTAWRTPLRSRPNGSDLLFFVASVKFVEAAWIARRNGRQTLRSLLCRRENSLRMLPGLMEHKVP